MIPPRVAAPRARGGALARGLEVTTMVLLSNLPTEGAGSGVPDRAAAALAYGATMEPSKGIGMNGGPSRPVKSHGARGLAAAGMLAVMNAPWKTVLDDEVARALPELVALRHDLHAHPQPAFGETYTAGVVQRELSRLGIEHVGAMAGTGVVGWIKPPDAQKANLPGVALRADMDALPIAEETGLPYAAGADYRGHMHACGHDGHTTILLGVARVLLRCREHLPQPVKLIYQPAEEVGGGAAKMIDAGAMDGRVGGVAVSRIFGLHNWPQLPAGLVATRPGPIMASTDLFDIAVTGRGGHGAMPHTTHDPIVAAAAIVAALQTIVSRHVAPTDPAVVSVTQFHSGTTGNVTPDRAALAGTIRCFDAQVRRSMHRRLAELSAQVAAAYGCRAQATIHEGYPSTVNDAAAIDHALAAAQQIGLTCRVLASPLTTAEDFSYYGQKVSACFVLLGAGRDGANPDLHSPHYDFNDAILPPAVGLMTAIALRAAG